MSCTGTEAIAHFGYKEDIRTKALVGFWANDGTVMQKLRKLPDVIEQYCTPGAKIQVIFDYDPNYPLALAQIRGVDFPDVLKGGDFMSERDELYNALVDVITEHGKNMEVGLVRAVLQEVDSAISMRLGRLPLKSIASHLKKRDCPTDVRASAGQDKNQ